jgi:3-phosphoshikimate 1-carboxyvinyltransferase
MLRALGVRLERQGSALTLTPPGQGLPGFEVEVPGDMSSASFFVTAAMITGRDLAIRGCGVNPTRCGFIEVARRMGAAADIVEESSSLGEPVGSVTLRRAGALKGAEVTPEEVPDLIDEIPLIAVLGLFAHGRTQVRGAAELRVKESDRLAMIARMTESLGGRLEIFDDGFAVDGPQQLRPGVVDPQGDHRIAMAAAVAGAAISGGVKVLGFDCSRVSYPDFLRDFMTLGGEVA